MLATLAGEQGAGDTGCEFARRIGGGGQGQGEEQGEEEGQGGQAGAEQRGLVAVVTGAKSGPGGGGDAGGGEVGKTQIGGVEGFVTVVKAARTCYLQ